MAVPKSNNALDVLQQMFNDVLVQTGKVLKTGGKDSKGTLAQVNSTVRSRIPSSTDTFHDALDDLESEIVRAKSVLLRDLEQLRAKRTLPAPATEPKDVSVAPPAPMVADIDSPKLSAAPAPAPAPSPAATAATTAPPPGAGSLMKTDNRPVAPFPNMGFDFSGSPETLLAMSPPPVPAPAPAAAPAAAKASPAKPSPKPAAAQAAMTGRPSSAPPKKESRAVPYQPPQSAATTTAQSPVSAAMAPTSMSFTGPLSLPPTTTPAPASALAIPDPEMAFTDMAFSLVPAANESLMQQQPEMDLADFGTADLPGDLLNLDSFGVGADGAVADMTMGPTEGVANAGGDHANTDSLDAEIDTLFNEEMDYNLGGIGLDNNNTFDDLYFGGSGDDAGESNETYFDL